MTGIDVRPARDDDAGQLIALVGAVFSEYPGVILDVDGELPDLRAVATAFARRGGRFWVAERGRELVGCIGVLPAADARGLEAQGRLRIHQGGIR